MWTKSTMGSNAGNDQPMVHTINCANNHYWIRLRTKQTQRNKQQYTLR